MLMRTRTRPDQTKTTTKTSIQDLSRILDWAEDYDKFARECVKFRGKNGRILVHSNPHPGQLKLREIQKHIHQVVLWVVLKARQVGASSEIASQLVHLALFNPGSSIAVAAQTDKGVKGMSALYAHVIQHLPAQLKTGLFQAEIGIERIHFPRLNSEIVFGTANSDSFRGVPRQAAHLTECAHFADLNRTLEVLRPTVHGPLIMESTANGPGSFHLLWNDPHVKHTFISWKDDATCVSDVPLPNDLTEQERQYIERNELSVPQASWFIQHVRQSNWESFLQEHPSTAQEAFRLGGDRFFQLTFHPRNFPPASEPFHCHQKPQLQHKYAIGADPASGSQSGDRSAFVLLDVTDPLRIETAASFAARIQPREFARQLAKVSTIYNGAVVCVERNAGWGLSVLDTLRQLGTRLYRAKVYDQIQKGYVDQFGWNTTATTRPLMLGHLQEVVDSRQWFVQDPRIEEEFNGFRHDKEGKPQAVSGCHDDLVLAAALALQAASQARTNPAPEPKRPKLPDNPTFEEQAQYEMATGELVDDDGEID